MLVLVDDCTLCGCQYCVLYLGLRCQVLVEVSEVILDAWHIGRSDLLRDELLDVEVGEPWVRQNLVNTICSEALCAILVQ